VEVAKQGKTPSQTMDLGALGLSIAPVSDELRAKYKLDEKQKGVVVTDVAANGTASDRGLKPGDVIVEVQQQPVATPVDVQKRLTEARDQSRKSVLLLVQGKDGMRWVPLPVKK
jgi:serine protease Do